jgi:hypothetical protein
MGFLITRSAILALYIGSPKLHFPGSCSSSTEVQRHWILLDTIERALWRSCCRKNLTKKLAIRRRSSCMIACARESSCSECGGARRKEGIVA